MKITAAAVVALLRKVAGPGGAEKGVAGTAAEGGAHVRALAGLEQNDHDQGKADNDDAIAINTMVIDNKKSAGP